MIKMAQDIGVLCEIYFIFVGITIWVLYKYPDLIHLDWIIMLIWMPIAVSAIEYLTTEGWCIYIHLGAFIMIEYLAFMQLINSYNRNKQRNR